MIFLLRIVISIIIFTHSLAAQNTPLWHLSVDAEQEYSALVDQVIAKPFYLEKLTCDSDTYIQPAEFLYLVDLPEQTIVDLKQIKRAMSYLRKKNKFKQIDIRAEKGKEGTILHWQLTGMWTLSRLTLHGLMFGKESYRKYYSIEPGEPFDEHKHTHSLNAVHEAFAHDGYFDGVAQATFDRDNATKTVAVNLNLAKGERYKIGNVLIRVRADEAVREQDLDFAREFLEKKLADRLKKHWYSKDLINHEMQRAKRLLAQEGFLQITIELNEQRKSADHVVDIAFSIDLHRKKEFIFIGNRFFSSEELLDTILLFGGSAWMLPASIVHDELIERYRKAGFWHVGMELQEEDERCIVLIQEGQRAIIDAVVGKGVAFVSEEQWYKLFGPLRDSYGDETSLQKAVDALLDLYAQSGFLDARLVKKEQIVSLGSPDHYTIELTIDEGARICVSSLTVDQFPELAHQGPCAAHQEAIAQAQPLFFDTANLKEQQQWLTGACKKLSKGDVRLAPECTRTKNEMAIVWKTTTAKKPIHFGKTVVVNNSVFPCEYVLRELQYKEGDVWDQTKIKQTHARLKALDLFETIHLFPHDDGPEPGEKAVMLKLCPDDPHELRLRVGCGLQQVARHMKFAGLTYKLGGTFIKRSPFNCGDLFRIDSDVTRSQRIFLVQYIRPWLFNQPIKTVLQGYNNMYIQPAFVGCIKSLYEVTQQGLMLGLTRTQWGITAGVNIGFDLLETKIMQGDVSDMFAYKIAHAINFEPRLIDRRIPFFVFEPTILCDFVDNKIQPTRGGSTLASLKAMLPCGHKEDDAHFVKFLIEQSLFVPLHSCVLGLRLRFGHIFHRHFSSLVPSERFYLGGAYSLRSYDTDFCPPLGCFIDECGRKQLVPQGGKSMVNANIELRFPLYKNLGGVVFQDLGMLSHTAFKDTTSEDVLTGTGFGLRYITPIGPLRFDIGFKWRSKDTTPFSYAWFLTFSNAF